MDAVPQSMWDDGDGRDGEYVPSEEERRAQEERGHTATHDPAYEALMSATRHEGLEARYSPRCVPNSNPNPTPVPRGCTQKYREILHPTYPTRLTCPTHPTCPTARPDQRVYFCALVCVRGRTVFVLGQEPTRASGVLPRPPMGQTGRCDGPRESAVDPYRCADPQILTSARRTYLDAC